MQGVSPVRAWDMPRNSPHLGVRARPEIPHGLDLIMAVRSNDELANLPVVAITSFGEDICELARAAGATDAIDKPTELEIMREVIDVAVFRSSSAKLCSNGSPLSELSGRNYTPGAYQHAGPVS
jgi:DNA-binding response OmpR family regulator